MNTSRVPSTGVADWQIPVPGPWPVEPDRHHVIVIGAGIGGLTAAALLARRGLKVLVLEAHDRPGGACSSWLRRVRGKDGVARRFLFDAGVQDISGLGPRGPVRRLLRELGQEDVVDWRRVRHRYIQDGLCLDLAGADADLGTALGRLFPHEADGIARLLQEIFAVYDDIYSGYDPELGVPAPPQTTAETLAWPRHHPRAARWLGVPYGRLLDTYVRDPRVKRLLTTIADYITDEPERLGVLDMVPLFGYYRDGGYYPAGGSQRLADVLRACVEKHGGRVALRCSVERILLEHGRAVGVVCSRRKGQSREQADLVLANCDVVATLTGLVDPADLPPRYAGRLRDMRRGPSAVLVNLGLDMVPDLPARVFLTDDGLVIGIGNPSAIDPTIASPGCAAVSLLCLLPEAEQQRWFEAERGAYRRAKAELGARLVAAVATIVPGLGDHIVYMQVAAPPTFTRYLRSRRGSIYGAARGQWAPAIRTPLPGVMLVGGAVPPGAGIEGVVITGTVAANLIAPPVKAAGVAARP